MIVRLSIGRSGVSVLVLGQVLPTLPLGHIFGHVFMCLISEHDRSFLSSILVYFMFFWRPPHACSYSTLIELSLANGQHWYFLRLPLKVMPNHTSMDFQVWPSQENWCLRSWSSTLNEPIIILEGGNFPHHMAILQFLFSALCTEVPLVDLWFASAWSRGRPNNSGVHPPFSQLDQN